MSYFGARRKEKIEEQLSEAITEGGNYDVNDDAQQLTQTEPQFHRKPRRY